MELEWQQNGQYREDCFYNPQSRRGYNAMSNPAYGQIDPGLQNPETYYKQGSEPQAQSWSGGSGAQSFGPLIAHRSGQTRTDSFARPFEQTSGNLRQQGVLMAPRPVEHHSRHNDKPLGMVHHTTRDTDSRNPLANSAVFHPESKQWIPNTANNERLARAYNQAQYLNRPCPSIDMVPQFYEAPQSMVPIGIDDLPMKIARPLSQSDNFVSPSSQWAATGLLTPGNEANTEVGDSALTGRPPNGSLAHAASAQSLEVSRLEPSMSAYFSPHTWNSLGNGPWGSISVGNASSQKPGQKLRKKRTLSEEGKLHAKAVRQNGGSCDVCKKKKVKCTHRLPEDSIKSMRRSTPIREVRTPPTGPRYNLPASPTYPIALRHGLEGSPNY